MFSICNKRDIQFPSKLRLAIIGGSGVGKSFLTKKLLEQRNDFFPQEFKKIIYCNSSFNQFLNEELYYSELKQIDENIILSNKIPTLESISTSLNKREPILLILDDFENELFHNSFIKDIFTKYGNHNNVSVIIILQNGSRTSGPYFQSIMKSVNCFILFENRSDNLFTMNLSKKIFPYKNSFLQKCFEKAYKVMKTHVYLVINLESGNSFSRMFPVSTDIFNNHKTFFKLP